MNFITLFCTIIGPSGLDQVGDVIQPGARVDADQAETPVWIKGNLYDGKEVQRSSIIHQILFFFEASCFFLNGIRSNTYVGGRVIACNRTILYQSIRNGLVPVLLYC